MNATKENLGDTRAVEDQTHPDRPGSVPPDGIVIHLAAAAPWMRFMAVLGLISVGLMAVAGLIILVVGFGSYGSGGRLLGILYIALAAVYLIPLLPLNRSAAAAARLKATPSHDIAAESLQHQASFWRRLGILAIVGLSLSVIFLLVALIAALVSR